MEDEQLLVEEKMEEEEEEQQVVEEKMEEEQKVSETQADTDIQNPLPEEFEKDDEIVQKEEK